MQRRYFLAFSLVTLAFGCRKDAPVSSASLPEALAAAKREGLTTDWHELEMKPVPKERNAALVYVDAEKAYKKLPEPQRKTDGELLAAAQKTDALAPAQAVLKRQAFLLKLAEKAAALPGYSMERDWSKGLGTPFPEYAVARQMVRLLGVRALRASEAGKPFEALADLERAAQIGRHIGSEPTLIAMLVHVACATIADRAFIKILQRHGGKSEVLSAARQTAATFGPTPDLRFSYRAELPFQLMEVANMRQGKPFLPDPEKPEDDSQEMMDLVKNNPQLATHWEQSTVWYWRRVYQELARNESLTLAARMEALLAPLEKRRSRSDYFVLSLAPVMSQAATKLQKWNAQAALREATLDLLETRLKTGTFSEKPTLPADPFDDESLRYRRTGAGFVLYSLAENGKDDGGSD
uniref:hypothetical protein n=1 Tax=Armatimonas sp. TaxID=1872638 RepID=UPI0037521FFE